MPSARLAMLMANPVRRCRDWKILGTSLFDRAWTTGRRSRRAAMRARMAAPAPSSREMGRLHRPSRYEDQRSFMEWELVSHGGNKNQELRIGMERAFGRSVPQEDKRRRMLSRRPSSIEEDSTRRRALSISRGRFWKSQTMMGEALYLSGPPSSPILTAPVRTPMPRAQ